MAGGVQGRGTMCGRRRGACMRGGHVWRGCMAGETAIAAGGTHPTGVYSCYS